MRLHVALLAACAVGAVSCTAPDAGTNPEDGPGRIRLYLTDAPGAYDQVNIVVRRIEAHRSGNSQGKGWGVLWEGRQTYDLLLLADGNRAMIADTLLGPGTYSQIRLLLDQGSNVVVDGQTHPLTVPSGFQTGVKLIRDFVIQPGALHELTLDFDAGRSIHRAGSKWMMKPVIHAHTDVISGLVEGTVQPASAEAALFLRAGSDTLVSAYADVRTGRFRMSPVTEGVYEMDISSQAGTHRDTTVGPITVIRQQRTVVDTVVLTPQ